MKKKLLVIIFIIVFISLGILVAFNFVKSKSVNSDLLMNRKKVVDNLGVTNDKQVVIKFKNDKKEESYYLFYLNDKGYTQYLYIFHKNEECYKKYIDEYLIVPKYSLKFYDNTYLTIIKLEEASNINNVNLVEHILSEYNNKKFEVVK